MDAYDSKLEDGLKRKIYFQEIHHFHPNAIDYTRHKQICVHKAKELL